MSIMFNEICINEEMLPKYTYFKLHDPAAHNPSQNWTCPVDGAYNMLNRFSPDDGPKSGRKY